jgi:hypothetical protein
MNDETNPNAGCGWQRQKSQPKPRHQMECVLCLTILAIIFSSGALIVQPEWVTLFGVIAICWLTKDVCVALLKQGRG